MTAPPRPKAPPAPGQVLRGVPAPPRTHSSLSNPAVPITGRMLAMKMGNVSSSEQAQAQLLQSGFGEDEVTQFDALIAPPPRTERFDDDEPTAAGHRFDGETPAQGCTSRDLFKALHPPVQSREGRRSAEIYRLVIDQFAVGTNPRYVPDEKERSRAHVFAWDVSLAMHVELPLFLGGRQLSLGLLVDWLRHEGPMKGWRRAEESAAHEAANQGLPVIVVPREIRQKQMGIVRPGPLHRDGRPALSAAGLVRGNGLPIPEALGVFAVEFFVHA